MNEGLQPGGPTDPNLPPNWEAPNGWPGIGNVNAIWFSVDTAPTQADIDALYAAGWQSYDPLSMYPRRHKDWSAIQYDTPELREKRASCPVLQHVNSPVMLPGGLGSAVYKYQNLGEYQGKPIHIADEHVNVLYADGTGGWSQGGEPIISRIDTSGYGTTHVVPGMTVEYDAAECLWRVLTPAAE